MEKIKVLQIGKYYYPYYYGGMENHLFNLCEDLGKKVKVDVLVSNVERSSLYLSLNGIRVSKAGKWGEVASTPISPSMISQLRNKTYDIVHIHLPNPMSTFAYFMTRPKGKLVVTWHSDIVRQKYLSYAYQPLQDWLLARCERVIVTSQNYLDTSAPLNKYREKCTVIPLGIDVDQFQMTDKIQKEITEIRSKYKNIIYFVGRLVYYKGVEYLIQAMQQVNGNLFIASNGPMMHKFKMMATKYRLDHKIFFLGELGFQKLLTFYHACDVFCLPAIDRSEAFGIVQLEAMICGKPVVSTQLNTGVTMVNVHNKTGLVVPPKSAAELSLALSYLIENKEVGGQMGEYARQRVRREFTKERVSERTLELYREIL